MMYPSTRELPRRAGVPMPLPAQRFAHYAHCVTQTVAARTIAFLDRTGNIWWSCGTDLGADERLGDRLRVMSDLARRTQWVDCVRLLLALPIAHPGEAFGALLVSCTRVANETLDQLAATVARRLPPVTARLASELAGAGPPGAGGCSSEEPTVELSRPFATASLASSLECERVALDHQLRAALHRLDAAFAAAFIPERAVDLTCSTCADESWALSLYRSIQLPLLRFLMARGETLLVNRPAAVHGIPSSKTLAVPIGLPGRGTIGLLLLLRDSNQPDFPSSDVPLAIGVAHSLAAHSQQEHDALTGMLRGSAMRAAALNVLAYRAAYEHHSLMYLDVDELGAVNEAHGHAAGDAVVTRLSALLRPPWVPADAIAARLHEDRFAVLLPGSRIARAQRHAQQVRAALTGSLGGAAIMGRRVTASIGIASLRLESSAHSFDLALLAAELASRAAKQRGGNCIEVYSATSADCIGRRIWCASCGSERHLRRLVAAALRGHPDRGVIARRISPDHGIVRRAVDVDHRGILRSEARDVPRRTGGDGPGPRSVARTDSGCGRTQCAHPT
jgi:diguanylate cyclase (GGDEF)-like protein